MITQRNAQVSGAVVGAFTMMVLLAQVFIEVIRKKNRHSFQPFISLISSMDFEHSQPSVDSPEKSDY